MWKVTVFYTRNLKVHMNVFFFFSHLIILLHVASHTVFNNKLKSDSMAHPASYPMSLGDDFPRDKVAGAWSWPLASI
jgi:hypothetical protein